MTANDRAAAAQRTITCNNVTQHDDNSLAVTYTPVLSNLIASTRLLLSTICALSTSITVNSMFI